MELDSATERIMIPNTSSISVPLKSLLPVEMRKISQPKKAMKEKIKPMTNE